MYEPSEQVTLSAANVVEHTQEGQPAQLSASVRTRSIGNSVERDCITKCNQQIHKVVKLPTCLPKLVNAQVIAESTGWSLKHVYRLAQQGRIPQYCLEGSIRLTQPRLSMRLFPDMTTQGPVLENGSMDCSAANAFEFLISG